MGENGAGGEVIHYRDQYISLVGTEARAEYIRNQDAAQCVPLTDTGMVIFIVEPSPALGRDILFLPGGVIEADELFEDAANRELQEEIGYKALRLDYLGQVFPWVKYLTGSVHLYLARDLTPSKLHGDEIYKITTELAPLDNLEKLIASGRLHDASVIASLYMARSYLLQEQEQKEQTKDNAP